MKKNLIAVFACFTAVCMTAGFVACKNGGNGENNGGNSGGNSSEPSSSKMTETEWRAAFERMDSAESFTVSGSYDRQPDVVSNLKIDKAHGVIYSNVVESSVRKSENYLAWEDGKCYQYSYSENDGWSKSSLTRYESAEDMFLMNDGYSLLIADSVDYYADYVYDENTQIYSFVVEYDEEEIAGISEGASEIKFENGYLVWFRMSMTERGTGNKSVRTLNFSEWNATTVTVPQEVKDGATETN